MALTWPPAHGTAPKKRDDLCLQVLDDELLVYDPKDDRVHALAAPAALVLELCDGMTLLADVDRKLSEKLQLEEPATMRDHVLSELARAQLLEDAHPKIMGARLARRALLKSLGTAALLVPTVTSITAPAAAQAGSCAGLLQLALGRPCCPGLQINLFGICISLFPGGGSSALEQEMLGAGRGQQRPLRRR